MGTRSAVWRGEGVMRLAFTRVLAEGISLPWRDADRDMECQPIRSRIERVIPWLERSGDVLAIQETKTREDQFPFFRFEEIGYRVAHHGLNQWNGVAIASRVGLDDVSAGFAGAPTWGDGSVAEARRSRGAVGGIRIVSVYVPNGRNIAGPHMNYKIEWLARLRDQAEDWLADGPTILMGTGISPRATGMCGRWSSMRTSRMSPRERAAFQAFLDTGYVDVVRPILPGPKVYTYWDYQQLRFQKGGDADRLPPSPDRSRAPSHRCGHRPGGAQRQGCVRSRAGPDRGGRWLNPSGPSPSSSKARPEPDRRRGPGHPSRAIDESRPSVVLAHGWTLNRTLWSRVIRGIHARVPVRVVAYDQRGHGESSPATGRRRSVSSVTTSPRSSETLDGSFVLGGTPWAG